MYHSFIPRAVRYLRNHLNPDDYAEISKQHPVAKTDLWRLIKMYNEGGVYMDVDRLVNVQLDNLLDKGAVRCVLPSFYQEAKQGVYQFSDFSQDVVISAPGNPMYSLAANLNVQRRRQCRQHGGNVWVPDGAPEAIRCIVFDLGPTTYMHAISQCLTGKQVRRGDHGYNAAVQRRVVELSPLLTVVAEQPPFDTVLFNGSVSGTTVMGVPSPGGDRPVEFEAWKNRVEELRQQDKKRFYCDMKITRDWQQHNVSLRALLRTLPTFEVSQCAFIEQMLEWNAFLNMFFFLCVCVCVLLPIFYRFLL